MSKTVDELVKVFNRAKWDQLRAGDYENLDRAGIAAVVRALRDDLQFWENDCHACDRASGTFREILGDAGNEKVADAPDLPTRTVQLTGITKSARPDVQFEPATDPAPAVCEWLDDGNPRKRRRNSCGLQGANQSWAGMNWVCTGCLKPIKFTEAK